MAELAQAYIHLKPYTASERKLRRLGRSAERLAKKVAVKVYGGGVEIEIELEEGSLRTRVTVYGAIILGSYSAIANYSGFKQSVGELCEDAREFAVDVCKPFVKSAGASDDQVYRFERRLKTPGKIRRLGRRLERLQRQAPELSAKNMSKELAAARRELELIASDLSNSEIKAIEREVIPKNLPPPTKWPAAEAPKTAVKPNQIQELMFDETPVSETSDQPRRLIYHSRTAVPAVKRRDRKGKAIEHERVRLFPPSR